MILVKHLSPFKRITISIFVHCTHFFLLRRLAGQQFTHQICHNVLYLICLAIKYYNLVKKNPLNLALTFDYFPVSLCTALLFKEISSLK